MKKSEYAQLEGFEHLPLYDNDDPFCSSIDDLPREGKEAKDWLSVHEATEFDKAKEYLRNPMLIPQGGICYWDDERKDSSIFAYFWEKR